MFMFTDFNTNPVDRHSFGYLFLYYVAALITINVLFLVVSLAIEGRRALLRWYILRNHRKQQASEPTIKAYLNEIFETVFTSQSESSFSESEAEAMSERES